MKAVVFGSGGWGTALSQVLCDNGHETYLWSHLRRLGGVMGPQVGIRS